MNNNNLSGYLETKSLYTTDHYVNSDITSNPEKNIDVIGNQERKYLYLPLIKNVKGYIVSQQDADNFLIDLSFNEKLKERYASVGTKKYVYVNTEGILTTGEAYKCHLFGVTVLDKGQCKGQRAYNLISRRINDSDGVVVCDLGDVDIYGRILVSIYDDANLVNLNKLLLTTIDKVSNKPFALKYGR
jgi:hypothetical protein